jgi:hypothetical protein
MSYWRTWFIAFAIDVGLIIGNPSLLLGPKPLPPVRAPEPQWVMNPEPGVVMETSSEDAQLDQAGRLEDSLMLHLQQNSEDVDAMETLVQMYFEHGWYDASIGPLARALQLDPERRSLWVALDRALEQTGMNQITDEELVRRAQAFVESVEMWGHGC